jgi:ribonuclease PH
MTAETEPFIESDMHEMLGLAKKGVSELVALQSQALAS